MKIKFKTIEQQDENIKLIKKTNFEKASYFLKISSIILIFDLLTYLISIELGFEDFGIFFEVTSLFFVILAIFSCNKQILNKTKIYILLSSIPIILLAIYDTFFNFINVYYYYSEYSNTYVSGIDFFALTLVLILTFNFKSYKSVSKTSTKSVQSPDNKDWFYDEK